MKTLLWIIIICLAALFIQQLPAVQYYLKQEFELSQRKEYNKKMKAFNEQIEAQNKQIENDSKELEESQRHTLEEYNRKEKKKFKTFEEMLRYRISVDKKK